MPSCTAGVTPTSQLPAVLRTLVPTTLRTDPARGGRGLERCTRLIAQVGVSYCRFVASKKHKPAHAVTCMPNQGGRQASAESLWRAVGPNVSHRKGRNRQTVTHRLTFPFLPKRTHASLLAKARDLQGAMGKNQATDCSSHNPPSSGTSAGTRRFTAGKGQTCISCPLGST